LLLLTFPEVLRISGAHVCALEIPSKDPAQVLPIVDLSGWEVLQSYSSRFGQKEGQVTNDEVVITHSPKLTGQLIVSKP
jgi:hypothetical protein